MGGRLQAGCGKMRLRKKNVKNVIYRGDVIGLWGTETVPIGRTV